ncbi:RNA 2',3'-cyclic phosphodiesterase [Bacillus sp. PS06]|uniref:RNA 2',3'-cyclic phosphodiesterase n=1 Tax=Bacillus sp. PS06 TaxID=2764176 RepID=UPI001781A66F|nr:RNA 2',3'-cyclic phosphodiesterase [Bacillus sp. PS06]MBD8069024.1 RNA 2',3'-cyclic phosphodiesterase [Bacillus sp. PS06]
MADHHYFLAVPIPKSTKAELSKRSEELKQAFPFKSWVHPEDYHITLAFLGSSSDEALSKVKEQMTMTLNDYPSFEIVANGIGTFGKNDAPRIFWVGVEKNQELSLLQQKIYQSVTEIGFSLDKRPYNPHITIARRWKNSDGFDSSVLDHFNQLYPGVLFPCHEVVLYQTHLDRSPKYEVISRFTLRE